MAAALSLTGGQTMAQEGQASEAAPAAAPVIDPDKPLFVDPKVLKERQDKANAIIADLKKTCQDKTLIEGAEYFSENIFSKIQNNPLYSSTCTLAYVRFFYDINIYLSEDLAGNKKKDETEATYPNLWSLCDLSLAHIQELENSTLRGDPFGDRLGGIRNTIHHYGYESYQWSEKAKEVRGLINKLTQACPDKEFTKTTESFLRSVMTIDAGREKEYLETANQNADAFFEQLTNSTNKLREEIRNGSPSFTGGEWLDTAKASHEILNRAARHTKEIVESLEQSEYKNDLTKLNQLIRSKGKETITTMYGLMKKSQPAPDADKATPGDTEKTSDPAPAPAKAPE